MASSLRRLMPNRRLILIVLVTEELQCTFLLTHCHGLKLRTVNHCHVVARVPLCSGVFKGSVQVVRLQLTELDYNSNTLIDWTFPPRTGEWIDSRHANVMVY